MKVIRKISALFRRQRLDADMAEEMRQHVDRQTELNRQAGMSAEDARFAALRQFGNVASLQDQVRAARGWVWAEQLGRDFAHALRTARKHLGFSSVVVLTLALGLGVNLAIVSLVTATLVRPLPGVRAADRLAVLGRSATGSSFGNTSYPVYRDYRAGSANVFAELAAFAPMEFSFASDNHNELVLGELVSGNYFQTLGVRMTLGRAFLPHEDEVPGRNPVAVISHRLWRERWPDDLSVIGRVITLNGVAFTIVGVAEPGFRALQLPSAHDVWVPLHMRPAVVPGGAGSFDHPNSRWLRRLVGRLAPGVTRQQAQDHISALAQSLQPIPAPGEHPAWTHRVVDYSPFPVPDRSGPYALFGILGVIALLVLGAVIVNAAGLFLSRALARRREAAVRLALGASRGRLIRQMVAEGLVLAVLAAALGVLGAQGAAEWLVAQIPGENGAAASLDLVLDWRSVAASVGLAMLTALAVGLVPAWQGSKVDVLPALKFTEGAQSARRSSLRAALVVVQIALSVVLLISAGLVYRGLRALEAADPTRHVDGMLLVRTDPRLNGYDDVRGREFFDRLLERVRRDPAVTHAALAATAPFADGALNLGRVHGGVLAPEQGIGANVNYVAGDYFRATGLPILRGRDFTSQDRADVAGVAIINRVLADRLWPERDPLGQLMYVADLAQPQVVVGVVNEDPSLRSPNQPEEERPMFYLPLAQQPLTATSLLVQTKGDPATLLPTVRMSVRELNAQLPLFQVTTLAAARDRTLWQQRLVTTLAAFCSLTAVLLALVGLYAALAQDVARRTREIGIRLAIGAGHDDVLWLVVGQGVRLASLGLGVGILAAIGTTGLLRSLLAGVSPTDPLTFILAPLGLGALAVAACWLPARRAAKVDPMVALRAE